MELILVIVLATNGLFLLVSFYLFVSYVIRKFRRSKQVKIVLTTLEDEFDSNCEEMYESKCEKILQVYKPKNSSAVIYLLILASCLLMLSLGAFQAIFLITIWNKMTTDFCKIWVRVQVSCVMTSQFFQYLVFWSKISNFFQDSKNRRNFSNCTKFFYNLLLLFKFAAIFGLTAIFLFVLSYEVVQTKAPVLNGAEVFYNACQQSNVTKLPLEIPWIGAAVSSFVVFFLFFVLHAKFLLKCGAKVASAEVSRSLATKQVFPVVKRSLVCVSLCIISSMASGGFALLSSDLILVQLILNSCSFVNLLFCSLSLYRWKQVVFSCCCRENYEDELKDVCPSKTVSALSQNSEQPIVR